MRVLGLIPARGGSKGVPGKNIRPLGGVPLITYTIRAVQASFQVDAVVTTTDDEKIASVAEQHGSELIRRPSYLGEDETPMFPVAIHALDTLCMDGRHFDVLLLLQCTCPFRTTADIDTALSLLREQDCDAVIGVQNVDDVHPARMYRHVNKYLESLDPNWEKTNRQNLPDIFHRNGVIYAIRCDVLRQEKTFFASRSLPYLMPRDRSINIDEEFDFQLAEFLISRDQNKIT